MMGNFKIDADLCSSCGKCVKECTRHIRIQDGEHVDPNNSECSRCFHCYTICPNNAIKVKDSDEIPSFNIESINAITDESLIKFLAYRRSTRSFIEKAVEEKTIERLIDAARYIPSGGNSHAHEFTILRSEEVKDRLRKELTNIYKKRSTILNNVLFRNLAKPFVNKQMRGFLRSSHYGSRMKDLVKRIEEGEDPFFYSAPAIVIIHSREQIPTPKEDCVLAGYNISLMAQTLGLGTCFVTLAQNAVNSSIRCKEIIGLTKYDNVNAVVVLGYPEALHQRVSPKPKKEICWC